MSLPFNDASGNAKQQQCAQPQTPVDRRADVVFHALLLPSSFVHLTTLAVTSLVSSTYDSRKDLRKP